MTDPGSIFPTAKDDDDDDVAWALSTAQVQWKRGSKADAVVWLRRAIDSAVAVSATWRAAELTAQTDALEQWLLSDAPVTIGAEATSLPPDAEMEDVDDLLSGDSTDERTDVTSEEEQLQSSASDDAIEIEPEPDSAVDSSIEMEEVVTEIGDDEIGDDEILDGDILEEVIEEDDLGEPGEQVRFTSEAPTANFVAPEGLSALEEAALEDDVSDTSAAAEPALLPYEVEEDPSPTPLRLDATDPLAPATEPEATEPDATQPEAAEPELSEPLVAGVSLAEVRGFEDFPPETQLELARAARVERLGRDEEVSGFGLALVLRGTVSVMPAIADAACGVAKERDLVYGRGTLEEGVALRLVAAEDDVEVAVWALDVIQPALDACPWVLDELKDVADNYQALAGVSMGPMGERLDDMLRGLVLERCKLVRLLPGEVLVEKGKPVAGLFIVGAGRIELGADAASAGSEGELGPGDFLFAQTILGGGKAPTSARAGASGALLMATDRHDAHELMVSVPPLLELLAG